MDPGAKLAGRCIVAREKVGVTLPIETWAYTRDRDGKEERFGFIMTPDVSDPGGTPYGTFDEGVEVLKELLRKAHVEAAERRREVEAGAKT